VAGWQGKVAGKPKLKTDLRIANLKILAHGVKVNAGGRVAGKNYILSQI
jgi:hypothetical protein